MDMGRLGKITNVIKIHSRSDDNKAKNQTEHWRPIETRLYMRNREDTWPLIGDTFLN